MDAKVSPLDLLLQPLPASTNRATRRRGPSSRDRCKRARRSSGSRARPTCTVRLSPGLGAPHLSAKQHRSSYAPLLTAPVSTGRSTRRNTRRNRFLFFRTKSHVMHCHSNDAAYHRHIPQPLQRAFPQPHRPRDLRILRQPTVQLRMFHVVQDVDHMGSTHSLRIVNSSIRESGMLAKLLGAGLRQFLHFQLGPKMQAASRARLDASRFESYRHAVVAQRAFENLARGRTEFWNVERAAGHAISAADAIRLLEIDDAVGVLNDGTV